VNQQVVSEILGAAGFGCQLVSNGRWAFDEVERHVYDLVLMDCQMPEMDGFETTRAIRAQEQDRATGKRLPIIALTANAVQGDRERCLDAGMDAYVTKPINPQLLIQAIENLLAQVDAPATVEALPEAEITAANTADQTEAAASSEEQVTPVLPVLDVKPLRARCLNDDSFLQRVLAKALTRIPADVLNIVSAAEQTDFDGLARSAHALAGMAANLEARQLLSAARGLEDIARSQQASALPPLLVQLRQAATQTEAAVEQLHNQLNDSVRA
jgi:CheY-like chemotaxis protein/HPt (histidine-containing phosphotransfer) domain-containing protein